MELAHYSLVALPYAVIGRYFQHFLNASEHASGLGALPLHQFEDVEESRQLKQLCLRAFMDKTASTPTIEQDIHVFVGVVERMRAVRAAHVAGIFPQSDIRKFRHLVYATIVRRHDALDAESLCTLSATLLQSHRDTRVRMYESMCWQMIQHKLKVAHSVDLTARALATCIKLAFAEGTIDADTLFRIDKSFCSNLQYLHPSTLTRIILLCIPASLSSANKTSLLRRAAREIAARSPNTLKAVPSSLALTLLATYGESDAIEFWRAVQADEASVQAVFPVPSDADLHGLSDISLRRCVEATQAFSRAHQLNKLEQAWVAKATSVYTSERTAALPGWISSLAELRSQCGFKQRASYDESIGGCLLRSGEQVSKFAKLGSLPLLLTAIRDVLKMPLPWSASLVDAVLPAWVAIFRTIPTLPADVLSTVRPVAASALRAWLDLPLDHAIAKSVNVQAKKNAIHCCRTAIQYLRRDVQLTSYANALELPVTDFMRLTLNLKTALLELRRQTRPQKVQQSDSSLFVAKSVQSCRNAFAAFASKVALDSIPTRRMADILLEVARLKPSVWPGVGILSKLSPYQGGRVLWGSTKEWEYVVAQASRSCSLLTPLDTTRLCIVLLELRPQGVGLGALVSLINRSCDFASPAEIAALAPGPRDCEAFACILSSTDAQLSPASLPWFARLLRCYASGRRSGYSPWRLMGRLREHPEALQAASAVLCPAIIANVSSVNALSCSYLVRILCVDGGPSTLDGVWAALGSSYTEALIAALSSKRSELIESARGLTLCHVGHGVVRLLPAMRAGEHAEVTSALVQMTLHKADALRYVSSQSTQAACSLAYAGAVLAACGGSRGDDTSQKLVQCAAELLSEHSHLHARHVNEAFRALITVAQALTQPCRPEMRNNLRRCMGTLIDIICEYVEPDDAKVLAPLKHAWEDNDLCFNTTDFLQNLKLRFPMFVAKFNVNI
jgi:hypothetical protein